jgi:carbonic anhydrase
MPDGLAGTTDPAAHSLERVSGSFDDLLAANAEFAAHFDLAGFDGVARAGVAVITCMDSRIDPIGMIGLRPGDAKVLRNPGGRVTDQAMIALILGVHLLGVRRVLVVPHTRCAMAASEESLRTRLREVCGPDVELPTFGAIEDQLAALREDVSRVREHPLIPDSVAVGGFTYDIDTGRLRQEV